eukprot:gene19580-21511_t
MCGGAHGFRTRSGTPLGAAQLANEEEKSTRDNETKSKVLISFHASLLHSTDTNISLFGM